MAVLRIRVLGPVRAWRDGDPLELGPAAQRAVLGLLALAGGRPLPRSEIMSGVWPDREPPASAANVIQTHVKHLRRLFEPDRPPRAPSALLRQVGDGYALHVPQSAVDALEFRRLVAAAAGAQRAGEPDRAVELLEEALALWHGPPLADVPLLAGHPKAVALAAERQSALGRYGEALLAAGRGAEALPTLEEAAAAQPMDEAGQARLIRAYHAAGRRGQAFATYHVVRRRLAEELGVTPGVELAAAHATLLHDDEPPPPSPVPVRAEPVPAQLPADLPEFVGRLPELAVLDGGYRVCVLSGAAGVGKTALAVHWAHRVASRFPDGQLYVNLRGFDPAAPPLEPAAAMRRFLDALDVPADRVPSEVDAQAALFRTRLAGRRVLVVLDNARDAAQVRPLLPGAAGCLVLVTSRRQLPSLVAVEGAQPVPLDVLSEGEARDLLVRRIGADRAGAEPRAAAEILDRCAGLPLAIAVVAARAVIDRGRPLALLAERLRRDRDRLDALTAGDPGTDLRAVLSWSYRALSPEAARLFRLLGLHPGPDVSAAAAVSLADRPPRRVRELLRELVTANLIAEHAPGRFALHDLLGAYAAEIAERDEPERARRAAAHRMVEHYLHSAHAAEQRLDPGRRAAPQLPPVTPGVLVEEPADHAAAVAWFTAERPALLALVERAGGPGAWRLAASMFTFLDRFGHWDELAATQLAAAAAARRAGDVAAEASARRLLARAYTRLGRLDAAQAELGLALAGYERAGDRPGQANACLNLALMWDRRGRHAEGLASAERALELFEAVGDRHGAARARSTTGWHHAMLGRYDVALVQCEQAMGQMRAVGDRVGEATIWDSLGYVRSRLGEHAESARCYHRSIELFRDAGDRHLWAMTLDHLGDAHEAAGDRPAARAAWLEALAVLEDLDHRLSGRLRAKLDAAPAG